MATSLKKVYLNFQQGRVVERMALEEGLLQVWGDLVLPGPPVPAGNHVGKSRLLNYIMLFETIDSASANYCWEPLAKIGLVDRLSPVVTGSDETRKRNVDQSLLQNCTDLALKNLLAHAASLLSYAINNPLLTSKEMLKENIVRAGLNKTSLRGLCKQIIEELAYKSTKPETHGPIWHVRFQLEAVLEWVLHCEIRGLQAASVDSVPFSTTFTPKVSKPEGSNVPCAMDKSIAIFKTNLSSEITCFPEPRNICEALEYRESPKMIRFREVLSTWIQYAQGCELALEAKIRADIGKASRELKWLKRYREYSTSPFHFFITSVGGHVPIIGNILTFCDTLGWLYDRWATYRVAWIN